MYYVILLIIYHVIKYKTSGLKLPTSFKKSQISEMQSYQQQILLLSLIRSLINFKPTIQSYTEKSKLLKLVTREKR